MIKVCGRNIQIFAVAQRSWCHSCQQLQRQIILLTKMPMLLDFGSYQSLSWSTFKVVCQCQRWGGCSMAGRCRANIWTGKSCIPGRLYGNDSSRESHCAVISYQLSFVTRRRWLSGQLLRNKTLVPLVLGKNVGTAAVDHNKWRHPANNTDHCLSVVQPTWCSSPKVWD